IDGDGPETVQHPADRGPRLAGAIGVDRARDDELVDRPRHRHVVQAPALRLVRGLLGLPHLVVVECAAPLSGQWVADLEAEAAVGQADDLLPTRSGPIAPGVRDDDDAKLEPLRSVDREQADGVRALLLGEALALPGPGRLLVEHEGDEALDIAAAQL